MDNDTRLRGLDLFSGIGGISLALEPWVSTKAYCENEPFAQAVLLSRMSEASIETAPIWDDVTTLDKEVLKELLPLDIIFGGFPCQDISVAGTQRGLEGKRSGLFFEIIRLTKEIRPSFVFLENVPNIRTKGLSEVVGSFAEIGYDVRWTTISAASVGAHHKRERWFMLASNTPSEGLERYRDYKGINPSVQKKALTSSHTSNGLQTWCRSYTEFLRISDGLPNRSHRIKALGNAVVPKQARKVFEILLGL